MEGMQPRLPAQVRNALQEVALHFRRRLRLRGLLRFGVATVVLLAVGTVLLMWAAGGGHEEARNTIIVVALVLEAVAAWRWLIRPMRVPIPLEQVALYVDRRFPDLEDRLVSALEFARAPALPEAGRDDRPQVSLWMIDRLLDETAAATRAIPLDADTRRWGFTLGRVLAGMLLAAAVVLLLANGRYWAPSLPLLGLTATPALPPPPFSVRPGDAEVRHGDNLTILAEGPGLHDAFAIAWRIGDGEWETAPMGMSPGAQVHHYELRNIRQDHEYRVQAGPHRSEVFTVTAWEPPRVQDIHLRYRYPEYLGRAVEEVPNGGPVSAVQGTRVEVEVAVNKALQQAELVLDSGRRIPLARRADALWAGEMLVDRDDKYRIEVVDLRDRSSDYEPVYDITALPDKAPEVRIAFPRGDDEVTPIEEIPFAVEVKDDFGVVALGIQYEVAGRDPVRIALEEAASSEGAPPVAAQGQYLLMLEDLDLSPGDLVTWTVWTQDQKPGRDPYETLGDPYFLEVRPFRRSFEEAVSNAGANQGMQEGGAGESESAMSQRDVLIATWNLRRGAADMASAEFREKRDTVVRAQEALVEQSRQAGGQGHSLLTPPGDEGDAAALRERLVRVQESAVDALRRADWEDPAAPLSEAMVHEQEAYSLLKKLEPDRSAVQQAQAGGQGQGQSRSGNQRELDQLELARNRNFYEEERPIAPPGQEGAEQARQALQELAQRQQVANEEMARLISEMQRAETPEEREELARRLKRLEEEMERNLERVDRLAADLASGTLDPQQAREARQGLNEARREMNRSLEEVRQERLQQARAAGSRATEALEEAEREMAGLSSEATGAGLRALRERMASLEERQQSILDRLEALKEREASRGLDDLAEQQADQQDLMQEKTDLAEELRRLMEDAGRLAQGAQQNQGLMARRLNDWLRETSGTGVLDAMDESQPLVNHGIWDAAIGHEERIREALRNAGQGLQDVEEFLVEDEADSLRLALRQIRDVLDTPDSADPAPAGEEAPAGESAGRTPSEDSQGAQPRQDRPGGEAADPGEGGAPGQEPGAADESGRGGSRGGAELADGRDGGYGGGGYGPEDLRRFFEQDYGRWVDAIRNAEDLLPESPLDAGRMGEPTSRQRLARAREAIGEMRRDYRGSGVAPKFEGFVDRVVTPLQEAAVDIDRRLQQLLRTDEFALDPRVDVPPQYQDRVAEYFRALSEAEASSS